MPNSYPVPPHHVGDPHRNGKLGGGRMWHRSQGSPRAPVVGKTAAYGRLIAVHGYSQRTIRNACSKFHRGSCVVQAIYKYSHRSSDKYHRHVQQEGGLVLLLKFTIF